MAEAVGVLHLALLGRELGLACLDAKDHDHKAHDEDARPRDDRGQDRSEGERHPVKPNKKGSGPSFEVSFVRR